MSGRRWIVRDTKCGNSQPFLGTRGWGFTVAAAGSYERREDADNALGSLAGCAPGRLVVRRVVPAGTKRVQAAARNDKATHWGPAGAKECCMVGLSDARVASCRSDVTCKNCLRHLDATDAAAQADADNVATMRAELEGLRATDEEMAAKLAAVTAERDAAVRDLSELRRAIEVLNAQARPAA